MKSNTRKYGWMGAGLTLTASLALVGCNNSTGAGGATGGATTGGATVAVVNGTNIGREDVHTYLEANGGENALRQLIDFELVMQHLKSLGLDVTEEELNAALAERQKQNPMIAEVVKKGGAQLDALKRSVRYQLAMDEILTKDVKVDAAAQQKWFEKNRTRYDKAAQVKIGVLFSSTKQRADVLSQQLKKGKTFLELVNEQKKANDDVAKSSTANSSESPTPGMPAPEFIPLDALPPAMKQAVTKLKPGDNSSVIELKGAKTAYAILKLIERQEPVQAKVGDPLPGLEYKLEQVARTAVKENPQNPDFDKTVTQVEGYLQQQGMQQGRMEKPTYREVLNLINQTAVQRLLTQLRGKSKVEISDPVYEVIAKDYQPTPPLTDSMPGGPPGGAASSSSTPSSGAPSSGTPSSGAPSGGAPSSGTPSGGATSGAAGSTTPAAPAAP